jgi:hypothetical protein
MPELIMDSYKSQTYSLLRDEPEVSAAPRAADVPDVPIVNVKHYALLDDVARQPRGRPRATMTVIMVSIGLLAGWIGGISLTGAFQHSRPAPDVSIEQSAVPPSRLQPDPRPSGNVNAPSGKSARAREAQADSQPHVEAQPPRATPIDEDKEQGDRWLGVPTREQSTKEIGRSAMDKILKENDKIKRGKHLRANKNED